MENAAGFTSLPAMAFPQCIFALHSWKSAPPPLCISANCCIASCVVRPPRHSLRHQAPDHMASLPRVGGATSADQYGLSRRGGQGTERSADQELADRLATGSISAIAADAALGELGAVSATAARQFTQQNFNAAANDLDAVC